MNKLKNSTYIYTNVMEHLVEQEIQNQVNSGKTAINFGYHVNLLEVATYALNRLPALYASSLEGREIQEQRGKQELKKKIERAVSLAFTTIEGEPERKSTPLRARKKNQTAKSKTYKNVMEFLIEREIGHQISHRKTAINLNSQVNLVEVATYALNRLPTLYASSIEGLQQQQIKAKKYHSQKIERAVSLAFAAIERDPIRKSTPLQFREIQPQEKNILNNTKATIENLDEVTSQRELAWIVSFMEHFLQRVNDQQISEKQVSKLYSILYYYWQDIYN